MNDRPEDRQGLRVMPARSVRTLLLVSGMRDNHCRECVASVIESMKGVEEVDVNLFRATAAIVHHAACSPEDFVRALSLAGYPAVPYAPD